jgi:hypothetical protein
MSTICDDVAWICDDVVKSRNYSFNYFGEYFLQMDKKMIKQMD